MFTGATQEEVEKALDTHDNDVVAAIIDLTPVPTISGTKHIPPPPKIDDGHDDVTRERIRMGRLMSDMISASPKNDLRGTASHYPVKEVETASAALVEMHLPTLPTSPSQ